MLWVEWLVYLGMMQIDILELNVGRTSEKKVGLLITPLMLLYCQTWNMLFVRRRNILSLCQRENSMNRMERKINLSRTGSIASWSRIPTAVPSVDFYLSEYRNALAYLDFPAEHRRRLRTNNVQERANREIKRRSRVVQVFPSVKSLIRLIGAVCAEIDEDWSSRHFISSDSLANGEQYVTAQKPIITEEVRQRATRLVTVAMESAQSERKVA